MVEESRCDRTSLAVYIDTQPIGLFSYRIDTDGYLRRARLVDDEMMVLGRQLATISLIIVSHKNIDGLYRSTGGTKPVRTHKDQDLAVISSALLDDEGRVRSRVLLFVHHLRLPEENSIKGE